MEKVANLEYLQIDNPTAASGWSVGPKSSARTCNEHLSLIFVVWQKEAA